MHDELSALLSTASVLEGWVNTELFWVGFHGLPTSPAKQSPPGKLSTEGHHCVPRLCPPLSCLDLLFALFFSCSLPLAELSGRGITALPLLGMSLESAARGPPGRGVTSRWPALLGVRCCLARRQLVSQSIFLFFPLFSDGIGDVLSHLRKQVEMLFNTRYGKLVISTSSSCWPLPWGAPNCSEMSPPVSKPASE